MGTVVGMWLTVAGFPLRLLVFCQCCDWFRLAVAGTATRHPRASATTWMSHLASLSWPRPRTLEVLRSATSHCDPRCARNSRGCGLAVGVGGRWHPQSNGMPAHAKEDTRVSEPGELDRARSLSSYRDSSDAGRLERDQRRLSQTRSSLERLYLEIRQDLQESQRRDAGATVRIRLLLRDAARRNHDSASARRRIRVLLKNAERRDREFAGARRRIKLLLNDTERRDREFTGAASDSGSRTPSDATANTPLSGLNCSTLKHLSAGLATGFLAVTTSQRWSLGNALASLPSLLLGRRPKTAADDLRPWAATIAVGQMPSTPDSPDRNDASLGKDQQNRQPKRFG